MLAAIYFSLVSNTALYRRLIALLPISQFDSWSVLGSVSVANTALSTLLLCLVLNRWTAKPLLALLLLTTAAAAYCMDEYTVYFNTEMLRNVLHTDWRESAELATPRLVLAMTVFGGLPALLLTKVRVVRRSWVKALWVRSWWVVGTLSIAIAAVLISFSSISSVLRNDRDLRYLITPGNYLVSLAKVALEDGSADRTERIPLGSDARVAARAAEAKPRLLVLIVGETVRAQNWGLNGYYRQTTPQLASFPVINFMDVDACGSSTEVSLPCMFSPWGRSDYDAGRIAHSESLLHVLDHAGIQTLWRDNQTGCKGVCAGLPVESFRDRQDGDHCSAIGCMDSVLLAGLEEAIVDRPGDLVIVLHGLGNHGPAYFRRYPEAFRQYKPECRSADLGSCTSEEITNAYDNAILYADFLVSQTIERLQQLRSHDAALIYLSDHGESLGESGIYLHGIPYAIAPQQQLKVPMVWWLAPGLEQTLRLDRSCMLRRATENASHDHLYHSVLGLFGVLTESYDASKDLTAQCRRSKASSEAPRSR